MSTTFELTIKPRKGWQAIDFKEAYVYRELLAFLGNPTETGRQSPLGKVESGRKSAQPASKR